MPNRVRLVHKTLSEGRFHVYTSPDVKGFHASGDTDEEARLSAMEILEFFIVRKGWDRPVVTFEEHAVFKAAS